MDEWKQNMAVRTCHSGLPHVTHMDAYTVNKNGYVESYATSQPWWQLVQA